MTDEAADDPLISQEAWQGLPEPKCFVVSPVDDGAYSRTLPTVTAVYVGRGEKAPKPEDLMRIDGGAVDRDERNPSRLQLSIFANPVSGDTESFTEAAGYDLEASVEVTNKFLDNLSKIKCFVFAVTADTYTWRCKIDLESSNASESVCDYRLLH